MLRAVFALALRQTEGLIDSILRLLGLNLAVPDHSTLSRRAWRKFHIGVHAETGQILASELTTSEVDDGSQIEPLLDQITAPLASVTADGAYDQTAFIAL
jgi:hypothetical protein